MALPQIVPPTTAGTGGRHVFVSYSHLDGELAGRFMRSLWALAGNQPELRLAPERMFYDRDKLKAGDDWDESIQSHLRRADLFLLLVSMNSLTSAYCLTRELEEAARLGIAFIPVLLTPTPMWKTRPVEGDSRKRRLGDFNAVPVSGGSGEQPIVGGDWATIETALAQAAEQIAARLMRDDATLTAVSAPPARRPPSRRALPPLLPYLCNQQPTAISFDNGLDTWPKDRALVVLLKGEFADDAPGFWERLRDSNLADYCNVQGLPIGSVHVFDLPRAAEAGATPDDVLRALRREVSAALFGNARRMQTGADIAAVLANEAGVLLLCTSLPAQPSADAALVLGALLALLDQVPATAPLQRLVVAVLIESPELVGQTSLVDELGLRGRSSLAHVVETRRLQPLTPEDVSRWYRRQELKDVLPLDEAQLLERLFNGAATLRHRPFDQQVRPLLGLAPEDSPR
jgi:hypothetical protein